MCGIVGYIGPREAAPILLEGLARLEYRGYDSAGIALVTTDGELFVEKRAGKLGNLRTALLDATPSAAIGLAHTRWATHGRPNDLNAHPHVDCTGDITVIHNGIIENFQELRDGLATRGHELRSETDTEALAHLVEEAYTGDLADAVRHTLAQAEGAYAVAVMHRAEPGRPATGPCAGHGRPAAPAGRAAPVPPAPRAAAGQPPARAGSPARSGRHRPCWHARRR